MEPQQPQYNPYEFITNPQAPKRSFLSGGGQKHRILVVAIGAGVFLILLTLGWALISSIGRESFDDLVRIGKTQQKIIYTTDLLLDDSKDPATRAFAATLRSSVTSDYAGLTDYMGERGKSGEVKQIGSGKDTEIEQDFAAAVQSGRVDDVFYATIDELLASYASQLQQAFDGAKVNTEKTLLSKAHAGTTIYRQNRES